MKRYANHAELSEYLRGDYGDLVSALKRVGSPVGGGVSIGVDHGLYFVTVYDCHGVAHAQSLRHLDPFAAANECHQRWQELLVNRSRIAWSLTPAFDSLLAVGA